MPKLIPATMVLLLSIGMLVPDTADAQRPRRTRVRARRTAIVIHRGHPIRRTLPATVVLRPARRVVTVRAPLVFLPVVAASVAVVTLPAHDHLVWQDSETIDGEDGWVDTNYGIDATGDALFLKVSGETELNFAEVTFSNGNVQVVDFDDATREPGLYRLLDFSDGRHVMTVRVLAQSKSDESDLSVFLAK